MRGFSKRTFVGAFFSFIFVFGLVAQELTPSQAHLYALYKSIKGNSEFETLKTSYSTNEMALIGALAHTIVDRYRGDLGITPAWNAGPNDRADVTFVTEQISKWIIEEKTILESEKFPFIHGLQGDLFVLLDFYKRCYARVKGITLNDNWFFLRTVGSLKHLRGLGSDDFYGREYGKRMGGWFDQGPVKNSLLALNLFMLGNLGNWGSCSIGYARDSRSMSPPSFTSVLRDMFTSLGFDSNHFYKHRTKVLSLMADHKNKGVALQVRVPKVYIEDIKFCKPGGVLPSYSSFSTSLKDCFDKKRNKISMQKLLHKIVHTPNEFDVYEMNEWQARLVLKPELVEDPNSGFEIRPVFVSGGFGTDYNKKLDALVECVCEGMKK